MCRTRITGSLPFVSREGSAPEWRENPERSSTESSARGRAHKLLRNAGPAFSHGSSNNLNSCRNNSRINFSSASRARSNRGGAPTECDHIPCDHFSFVGNSGGVKECETGKGVKGQQLMSIFPVTISGLLTRLSAQAFGCKTCPAGTHSTTGSNVCSSWKASSQALQVHPPARNAIRASILKHSHLHVDCASLVEI